MSDAAVHDGENLAGLLNKANTFADVFADGAYRSAETKAGFKARGFRSRIHVRATRNHPSHSGKRKQIGRRARFEFASSMCLELRKPQSAAGSYGRSASLARAKAGLQNLVKNARRLVTLEQMATV